MKKYLLIYALIFSLMALCTSCALAKQQKEAVKKEYVQDVVKPQSINSDSLMSVCHIQNVVLTCDCYFEKSETIVLFGSYWLKVKEVKPYKFSYVVNYVLKLNRGNNSPPKNYI